MTHAKTTSQRRCVMAVVAEHEDHVGPVLLPERKGLCPVGALVSKDFLYKARAWDLQHTPSVCPSCSQGCNIDLHTRDNLVQRIKPR